MLKHNGTYFLMYSEGKCTDTSYKVRYSTSTDPLGPWKQGAHSPVLQTDMDAHVYGPGHHTILQFKGKYYIVYHRISDHINDVNAKDLLREICIDPIEFDDKGDLIPVHPSH
jgi:beta-xylosidase